MTYIFEYYKNGRMIVLHVSANSKENAILMAIHRAKDNNGILLRKKPVGMYNNKK